MAVGDIDPSTKFLPNGLPDVKPPIRGLKTVVVAGAVTVLPLAIGCGIAHFGFMSPAIGVWSGATLSAYDSNMKNMPKDFSWVLFAIVLFSRAVNFLNMYPALFWKTKIMPIKGGNLRANMQIYQVIGDGASKDTSVVLATEGDVGAYNRANRSLTHFVENAVPFALGLLPCGLLYPFPTFLLTATYMAGRVWHQVGYTRGYGAHGAGFGLASLAGAVMEGLLFLAGWKML